MGGSNVLFLLKNEVIVNDFYEDAIGKIIEICKRDEYPIKEHAKIASYVTLLSDYSDLIGYNYPNYDEEKWKSYLPPIIKQVRTKISKPFPGEAKRWFTYN